LPSHDVDLARAHRDRGRSMHAAGDAWQGFARGPLHRHRPRDACGGRSRVMSRRHIGAVMLRQLYLLRGSPSRALPLFAWIAIDILLWGFITRYLNAVARPGFDFVPAVLGAVLLWDFLTRVMQGVTMAFFEDVWSRNFLNIFATPLRTSEYLTVLVLPGVGTSLLSLIAMVVFARLAFGLSFLTYGVALAP